MLWWGTFCQLFYHQMMMKAADEKFYCIWRSLKLHVISLFVDSVLNRIQSRAGSGIWKPRNPSKFRLNFPKKSLFRRSELTNKNQTQRSTLGFRLRANPNSDVSWVPFVTQKPEKTLQELTLEYSVSRLLSLYSNDTCTHKKRGEICVFVH